MEQLGIEATVLVILICKENRYPLTRGTGVPNVGQLLGTGESAFVTLGNVWGDLGRLPI